MSEIVQRGIPVSCACIVFGACRFRWQAADFWAMSPSHKPMPHHGGIFESAKKTERTQQSASGGRFDLS